MDSLVQPLVAQYLAMGCQSKENCQNENVATDEKGKDDARATPGCSSRSRVSPPGRPHRFHKPSPAQTTPAKSMMSLGHLTKGASWEELIQACLQVFGLKKSFEISVHMLQMASRCQYSTTEACPDKMEHSPAPPGPHHRRTPEVHESCHLFKCESPRKSYLKDYLTAASSLAAPKGQLPVQWSSDAEQPLKCIAL
ncbi:hypothetical protein PAMP_005514 [Pampus punctatissimus]